MMKAPITEIFDSLQGEGPYQGERQIFVRFRDCGVRCDYCDEYKSNAEDLSVSQVMERIETLNMIEGLHRHISWTGGEPLLYSHFLRSVMLEARRFGFKNYLETNGILTDGLRIVLDKTDVIAMDMKPSSMTGSRSFWKEHEDFLRTAQAKEVFVKLVLSRSADLAEFDRAVEIIRDIRPETLLVLQPLSTEAHPAGEPETLSFLEALKERAGKSLSNVRVIERLHKILNIR
jgi:organic radical activating enzyme